MMLLSEAEDSAPWISCVRIAILLEEMVRVSVLE